MLHSCHFYISLYIFSQICKTLAYGMRSDNGNLFISFLYSWPDILQTVALQAGRINGSAIVCDFNSAIT